MELGEESMQASHLRGVQYLTGMLGGVILTHALRSLALALAAVREALAGGRWRHKPNGLSPTGGIGENKS